MEFGLENRIIGITGDTARNMSNALKILKQSMHIKVVRGCAAHVLNLVVSAGNAVFRDVVYKVREFVRLLHSSETVLRQWREILEFKGMPLRTSIPQEVATRWNSTFLMLSAYFKHLDIVNATLVEEDYDLLLNDNERLMLERLHNFLTPFYQATVSFSKTSFPSLGKVILVTDHLASIMVQEQKELDLSTAQ
ncbi:hypothetical protein RCL1_007895 [Eukaryota sp. TZLM3-RCL]